MFENKTSGNIKGDWIMNSHLDSKQIGAMDHMKKIIFDALNAYNEENNTEERAYN